MIHTCILCVPWKLHPFYIRVNDMGLDYLRPFILITCLNSVFGVTVPCNETYLAKNGHRCYPCSAGYYKVSDCVIDGEQSRCRPCGNGEYLPTCDNSTQCYPCDLFCHGGQVQIKACTPTSNLKCQCEGGYYWEPDPHRFCTSHSQCIPGEGLKAKGTPDEDTKCEPCKHGLTYSESTSLDACTPCSMCNVTLSNCSVTQDAICDNIPEVPPDTKFIPKDVGDKPWVVVIVVILVSITGIVVAGGVVVLLCVRRRRNKHLYSGAVRVPMSSCRRVNGHVDSRIHNQSAAENFAFTVDDTRNPNVSGPKTSNIKGQSDARNSISDPSSVNGACSYKDRREDGIYMASTESENQKSLKTSDNDYMTTVNIDEDDMVDINGVTTRDTSKSTYSSIQKDETISIHGQTDSGTNDIKEKASDNFEQEHASDKPDLTEQIFQNNVVSRKANHVANGTRYMEINDVNVNQATSEVSLDVGCVTSRHVQLVAPSVESYGQDETETNGTEDTNTTETGCSASSEAVTDDNRQSDNGTRIDTFWFEVCTFLSLQFEWNKFKQVYRRLIAETNGHRISTIDACMDNTLQEIQIRQETMYQLMLTWRKENPGGTTQNIIDALSKSGEKLTCEKFTSFIENLKKSDKRLSDINNELLQDIDERHVRGELSTTIQMLTMKEEYTGNFGK